MEAISSFKLVICFNNSSLSSPLRSKGGVGGGEEREGGGGGGGGREGGREEGREEGKGEERARRGREEDQNRVGGWKKEIQKKKQSGDEHLACEVLRRGGKYYSNTEHIQYS